jgi:XTP/dITP diphosphohydrolase
MKKILFITGNKRKIWQAETTLEPFGIKVEAKDLDVPEIQSHDPMEVARSKANAAYELAGRPVAICDFSWNFPALNGFPGSYMKDMNHWFTSDDFLRLMHGVEDRRVIFIETIVYSDGKETKEFSVTFNATLTHEPRGKNENANYEITIYEGSDKTIAEHYAEGTHARDMSKSAWQAFGEWYNSRT